VESRHGSKRRPPPARWLRTGQLRGVGLIGWIVTAVAVAVAVRANTVGAAAIAWVVALCLAIVSLRCQLAGVRADADGVTIRGPWRTWRVPWSELEGFSFEALGGHPAVGVATLRDGSKLAMTAVSTGRVDSASARLGADTIVGELNQLLERARLDQ
jgi:Bacterial PH domain